MVKGQENVEIMLLWLIGLGSLKKTE